MKPIQAIFVIMFATCYAWADAPEFAKDVAPILNRYCVGCHSGDTAEAELVLDTFEGLMAGGENGPTIDQNNLQKSLLVARITGAQEPAMPPKDEPQPSKAEIATLVKWVSSGVKRPFIANKTEFDKLPPSDAPKSVTAIAYRTGIGQLTVMGMINAMGIEIKSKKGLLIPVPGGQQAPADPFGFLLSNTKNSVIFASLPGPVKINGTLELPVRYTGHSPADDLTVQVGTQGGGAQPMKFRVGGGMAIAGFGVVELSNSISQKQTHVLRTPGKVHSLQFSLDGSKLIAATGVAGLQGEAILWNSENGEVLQRFQAHNDTIYAAALSDDGTLVATGSYDRTIIIWNAQTGRQLRTLRGHNGAIYDLTFSPDAKVLASASADATVKIWNVRTGERLDTLGQPLKEQYTVDISPDGQFVIAGGEDNRIRMWRLVSVDKPQINPIMHARFAHEAAIQKLRFTADGKSVVSSAADKTLKIWSTNQLNPIGSYELPHDSSQALALSADGKSIGVGRMNGKVASFQLRSMDESLSEMNTVKVSRVVSDQSTRDYQESEPNDRASTSMSIKIPASIKGRIYSTKSEADEDVFQFAARAGEEWVIEIKAARDKSPLDSFVSILQKDGSPLPRVQLQAMRDSYFTFRGKDSNGTGDFRLHNWEEMRLNQLLYCSGEVVKLYHYPRGPDSGFNVYPNFGSRRGYFDTTPMAHALHEPCYVVEPHPPGIDLPPNGLPVFALNYENDDDSQRRLGKDSRLTFVAPRDDDYFVALRDVRGLEGEDFAYELLVRPPKPNFSCKVMSADPEVSPGTGKKFGVEVERIDGFDGPIDIEVTNLPAGFSVAGPLQIEAAHDRLWATLFADEDAKTPSEDEANVVKVVASATVGAERIEQQVGSLGMIKVTDSPQLTVELIPDHAPTLGDSSLPVVELKAGSTTTATIKITRKDHDGRVGFGNEDGAVNAPHGVYVDNIGLNGVLIVEGQNKRQFFITAESWVKPMERVIFVESGDAGQPTSNPVLLRILPPDRADPTNQVSR